MGNFNEDFTANPNNYPKFDDLAVGTVFELRPFGKYNYPTYKMVKIEPIQFPNNYPVYYTAKYVEGPNVGELVVIGHNMQNKQPTLVEIFS